MRHYSDIWSRKTQKTRLRKKGDASQKNEGDRETENVGIYQKLETIFQFSPRAFNSPTRTHKLPLRFSP